MYIYYGDNMKRFKSKKRKSISKKFIVILIIIFLAIKSFNIKFNKSKKGIIDYVFNSDINYSYKNNVIYSIYNVFNKNIMNNPVNILRISNNKNNTLYASNILYVENKPKVYIYNTHQSELYVNTYMEESNITPNVILASSILKDKLEKLNIKTIVETSSITDYMNKNNLNYGESYVASRYFLNQVYKMYPNLDLYIDLHRDAVTHDISTININGKKCARILFVVGLENPNYGANLNVVNKLNNIIFNQYGNLTRGIMKKSGVGVNGVYNQDLNSNVVLIEVGGNENNIDEVNNTLELLAKVIEEYINEKEKI